MIRTLLLIGIDGIKFDNRIYDKAGGQWQGRKFGPIKRLDVSSPKDGAVSWSGDPEEAQRFAEGIGGVTLETTSGGRIIDGWDEVNKGYPWDRYAGEEGPYARDLWAGA
jgi:hypothetical protein